MAPIRLSPRTEDGIFENAPNIVQDLHLMKNDGSRKNYLTPLIRGSRQAELCSFRAISPYKATLGDTIAGTRCAYISIVLDTPNG